MAHEPKTLSATCRCGETKIALTGDPYDTVSPRLLIKLLDAWAAMGFRRPKIRW